MIVHFTARQAPLAAEAKQYCDKRLKALDKLLKSAQAVDLIFAATKNRQRVEVHVKAKGGGLVVQEEGSELMRVLDQAFDNLERKLKKDKEKYREKKRRMGRELPPEAASPSGGPEAGRRIVRSDDISLKPISVEEAALMLDETKKDILAFRKIGSERWAILYRRKDGRYALLEPEG